MRSQSNSSKQQLACLEIVRLHDKDDSANQSTVPESLAPLLLQLSSHELPSAVLETGKPPILTPTPPEEDSAVAVPPEAEA